MKFLKSRKKHVGFDAENLAFPEVHIDTDGKEQSGDVAEKDIGADEGAEGNEGQVVFDNLAVPEIKLGHRRKLRNK